MTVAIPTYSALVRQVLDREYRPFRGAAKLLAADADISTRTAEKWLAGEGAPHGDALVNLMARCDAMARGVMALAAQRRDALHARADAIVHAIEQGTDQGADHRFLAFEGC